MVKFSTFDAAGCLDNEEIIVEYISASLNDSNTDVFLTAVRDVIHSRGMTPYSKYCTRLA